MNPESRKIKRALADCAFFKRIVFLPKTQSTNDVVKSRAEKGAEEGLVVFAGTQTRGRGRHGSAWLSFLGKGVYVSVLLRPGWPVTEGVLLNICASVAVARALERFSSGRVRVKWPNDVMLNGRKVAGILVEQRLARSKIEFAVVGIGVNVLHEEKDFETLPANYASSLLLEGVQADCDRVMVGVLKEMDVCYTMTRMTDRSRILAEWAARRF